MARIQNNSFKISITELQYFSQCRRKFWLEQTWEPKAPRPAFWTGSLVHAGLEKYYRSGRDPDIAIDFTAKQGDQEIDQIYKDLVNTPYEYLIPEYEEQYELALGMVTNYTFFDEEDPILGTVKDVEKYFAIPIGELSNGMPVKISGKIDLVMNRRRGGIWIVDHKTSAQRMSLTGLEVDAQLTGYAWALWALTEELPRGVLYNILLKDLPVAPKTLIKKDAEEPHGLSKDKSQKTTYEIYLATLEEYGFDRSAYEEILTHFRKSGWDKFFQREGSTRNRAELIAFQEESLVKADDAYAILSDPDNFAYPSASTYNCGYCSLISVCKAMSDGGDYRSILDSKFKQRYS